MTTKPDNVYRTVADDGPPDPSEHEWVLWRNAKGEWRTSRTVNVRLAPATRWVPFTPPSAPAPPPRWTVKRTYGHAPAVCRDGKQVEPDEVVDLLNAADRPDTGDGFDVAGLRA